MSDFIGFLGLCQLLPTGQNHWTYSIVAFAFESLAHPVVFQCLIHDGFLSLKVTVIRIIKMFACNINFYYIAVFGQNAIFNNFGNIMLNCRFALYHIFSCQILSAASRPICTKFGTNVFSCMRLKQIRAIFEKLKNQITTAKNLEKIGIFSPWPSRFRSLWRNG